jgi:micrococcal nuclease
VRSAANSAANPAVSLCLFIVLVIVCTACDGGGAGPVGSSGRPVTASSGRVPPGDYFVVDRVVDGDTIVVREPKGEVRVRLIGVDTPESVKPGSPVECFAVAASKYARHALTNTLVRLEYDVDRLDRYGRTLAYVWVGSTMFNEQLVRDGYAVVETVPPDVRYAERFLAAERDARRHDRGLWSACITP